MNNYKVIIFDVDSTLVKIEGLDWLAKRKGKYEKVSKLTKEAMEGKLEMKKSMEQKMEMICPSYKDLEALGQAYCKNIISGVKEAITILRESGKEIWIVSGNFQPAIGILAKELGICEEYIVSNQVFFDVEGKYCGFDTNNPLSKNHGKAAIINSIRAKSKGKTVLVGDGFTDLEAKDTVDLFVAFAGVVKRDKVIKGANAVIYDSTMLALLQII